MLLFGVKVGRSTKGESWSSGCYSYGKEEETERESLSNKKAGTGGVRECRGGNRSCDWHWRR